MRKIADLRLIVHRQRPQERRNPLGCNRVTMFVDVSRLGADRGAATAETCFPGRDTTQEATMSEGTRQTGTKQDYGLECPHCGCRHFKVIYIRPHHVGRIMRRRMHVITKRCRGRWRRCVGRISPKLHAYHAPAGAVWSLTVPTNHCNFLRKRWFSFVDPV